MNFPKINLAHLFSKLALGSLLLSPLACGGPAGEASAGTHDPIEISNPTGTPTGPTCGVACEVLPTYNWRLVYSLNDSAIHLYDGVDIDLNTDGGQPAISNDRSSIAYVGADGNIWTMAVDGTNKQQITDASKALTSPSFSPDGTQLVFATSGVASWSATVHTVSVGARKAGPAAWKLVTSPGNFRLVNPRFVNASAIAFEYNPGAGGGEISTIVVVDALKTDQTPSSASWKGLENLNAADNGWYIYSPSFSDDGLRITYVKAGQHTSCGRAAVMEATLNSAFDVSNVHELYCNANFDSDTPDFEKGAGTVAFVLQNPLGSENDVYTIDVDGANLTKRVSAGSSYLDLSFE
jgi:hypothetical protein